MPEIASPNSNTNRDSTTNATGRFSNEALDEFIAIYKEEFGEEIDRKEATEMAWRLLTLCRLLSRKLPVKQNIASHDDHRSDSES
jgi:hypothetical protein